MNELLRQACDLLIENRKVFKKVFRFDYDHLIIGSSLLYANYGLVADEMNLKYCNNLIKESTGLFSDLRGNIKIPLIAMMAISDNSDEYLEDIRELNNAFNKGKKIF